MAPPKDTAAPSKAPVKKGAKAPVKKVRYQKGRLAKRVHTVTKVRPSITPGTVLILLRGVYAGRRVVFVKQLPKSGNLLVTGPTYLNGVPFYRVAPTAVIATSTKVDISAVKIDASINEDLFKKASTKVGNNKSEAEFFKADQPKPAANKAALNVLTKALDKAIVAEIKKVPLLSQYLQRNFFLKKGDRPHLMKF